MRSLLGYPTADGKGSAPTSRLSGVAYFFSDRMNRINPIILFIL